MKRLLCLLLCLAMVLSMAACGKATPTPSEKEPTSSQPADPAPEAQPAPETEPENPDNAYIDERWVAVDYSRGRIHIDLRAEGISGGKKHTIRVVAKDNCGNKTSWEGDFIR